MNWQQLLFSENKFGNISSIGLLGMRLYFGISMASAGFDKLPVPVWMVDQVTDLNFPFPAFFAALACYSEFLGGILIVLGLFTRPAAFFISITMGVAAFVHHGATPFLQIHVAQDLFWMGFCLAFAGAGKFGLDFLSTKKEFKLMGLDYTKLFGLIGGMLLLISFYRGFIVEPRVQSEDPIIIHQVSLAGSFNDWNLESNFLEPIGDSLYVTEINLQQGGPIEFKFAANKSWDLNLGDEDINETFPIKGQGEIGIQNNIKGNIPKAGRYRFKVDLNDLTYEVLDAK